jgi:hypothetical protein
MNPALRADVTTDMESLLSVEGLKLLAAVEGHHESARSHLIAPTGPTLAGVVWLSAHLSATEHAIHRALPPGSAARAAVHADQAFTGPLKHRLRVLERQLSGDSTVRLATEVAGTALMDALNAHSRTELTIIEMLDRALSQDELQDVVTCYRAAVEHGPTRPHPHGRHSGAIEPMLFALNSASDRVMDTLDSRPSPLPHAPKTSRRLGRWSLYVLGTGVGAPATRGQPGLAASDQRPE